jgi:hypothetical protein
MKLIRELFLKILTLKIKLFLNIITQKITNKPFSVGSVLIIFCRQRLDLRSYADIFLFFSEFWKFNIACSITVGAV